MKKLLSILIPSIIIAGTVLVIYIIFNNPPKAKTKPVKSSVVEVEIKTLQKEEFLVKLDSYGTARAATQTTLTSQVSGEIVYVSEKFEDGAHFKKGELLVKIEDADYKADVKIAEAELLLANQTLLEEEAKAKQAREDWKKFKIDEEPNSLVLRIPQVESAKANLIAAKANLEKAKLNLQRTQIVAPYDGRVIEKMISIAQVIPSNTGLGTIFEDDTMEIRLPIKNKDLELIDLEKKAKVELVSSLSNETYEAKVIRTESKIDTNTKQLYLIAQLQEKNKKVKIGEYLTAKIEAKKLQDVLIIPNDSVYQSSYVYIEKEKALFRKPIEILWQDNENSLIKKGLQENDNLVLTTLGLVSSGTKVKVINNGDIK